MTTLPGESLPRHGPAEEEVTRLLGQVLGEFADRHEQVESIFRDALEQ